MTMLALLIQKELYQGVDKICMLQCSLKHSTHIKKFKMRYM